MGAAYLSKKLYNERYTKIELSNQITSLDSATKFIFDPEKVGSWNGDSMVVSIFITEYILKKYPDACKSTNIFLLLLNYVNQQGVADYQKEIREQSISESFREIINECRNYRFIIIPLNIILPEGTHANMLIYDKTSKTMTHFEPNGGVEQVLNTRRNIDIYSILKDACSDNFINYCEPTRSCPYIGPQVLDGLCPSILYKFNSPIGFCAVWSTWYIVLRLENPDMSSSELISNAVKNLNINLCKFIRGYSLYIYEFSQKFDLIKDEETGLIMSYSLKV
jgi:hypothetical protein